MKVIGRMFEECIDTGGQNDNSIIPRINRAKDFKPFKMSKQSISSDWLIQQWKITMTSLSSDDLKNLIRNIISSLQHRLNVKELDRGDKNF